MTAFACEGGLGMAVSNLAWEPSRGGSAEGTVITMGWAQPGLGHSTVRRAALSGAWILLPQAGHLIEMVIRHHFMLVQRPVKSTPFAWNRHLESASDNVPLSRGLTRLSPLSRCSFQRFAETPE